MPAPSCSVCSTFGRTVQRFARRSSPNHDTTTDTDPTRGNSRPSVASETSKSVPPIGVLRLRMRVSPSPRSTETSSVASAYSPVPGISATACTFSASDAAPVTPRVTSNESCGTRFPHRSSASSSSTT